MVLQQLQNQVQLIIQVCKNSTTQRRMIRCGILNEGNITRKKSLANVYLFVWQLYWWRSEVPLVSHKVRCTKCELFENVSQIRLKKR